MFDPNSDPSMSMMQKEPRFQCSGNIIFLSLIPSGSNFGICLPTVVMHSCSLITTVAPEKVGDVSCLRESQMTCMFGDVLHASFEFCC